MTKGRAVLPGRVVAEQEPFFITLGGPQAHDSLSKTFPFQNERCGPARRAHPVWNSDGILDRSENPWNSGVIMCQDDRHGVVQRLRSQYQEAKETLAALLASIVEIAQSSSITIKEGCLMYSVAGLRLLDTNYVPEQVAQYRAARERKEALRKRLMDLGEPDPNSSW